MSRIERIKKILEKKLKPDYLTIRDNSKEHKGHNMFDGLGETHVGIEISSNFFNDKTTLYCHKFINSLLKNEFDKGLHSLEIKVIKN